MEYSFALRVHFFGGEPIARCCDDLQEVAERMGCLVEGDFNGVTLWAKPGGDPRRLEHEFNIMAGSKRQVRIAQSWGEPGPP